MTQASETSQTHSHTLTAHTAPSPAAVLGSRGGGSLLKNPKVKTIAYWVTTIFGPASFVVGGIINLTRSGDSLVQLAHLGYPAYFATILGLWKLLGAIVVVIPRFPRLKEWAYAGFFFDLTAAAASRAFVGDGLDQGGGVIAPLVFLALVMASWALRPASRKLG